MRNVEDKWVDEKKEGRVLKSECEGCEVWWQQIFSWYFIIKMISLILFLVVTDFVLMIGNQIIFKEKRELLWSVFHELENSFFGFPLSYGATWMEHHC